MTRRPRWADGERWRAGGQPPLIHQLEESPALGLRRAVEPDRAARWGAAVLAAADAWTADFGGEQFALGRAFYTHLETGQSAAYFGDAAASDARVERTVPGLQENMRELMGALVGAAVRPRPGFCSAGVHVFPAREAVARDGGVIHFDLEGLTPWQLSRRARAVTLVLMLSPPRTGGGLRVWDALWNDSPAPDPRSLGAPHTIRSRTGDAVLLHAYRLHQIEGFTGDAPRLSATLHAAETDRGAWESWF